VEALFDLSFPELMFQATHIHRTNFNADEIQLSQLLSVKTGGCAEDCGYCSQSAHFATGLKASRLMNGKEVVAKATEAKANGAQRFCMGAAWRDLKDRDLPSVTEMISGVKALGLETCAILGMLTKRQAAPLRLQDWIIITIISIPSQRITAAS
jgi:biotin synthase